MSDELDLLEYLTSRLSEVETALERLDAADDPLAHSLERRVLVDEAARILSAVAAFRPDAYDA